MNFRDNMSSGSYFSRYVSPNIVIVPMVTPIPGGQNLYDTATNSKLQCVAQIGSKEYNYNAVTETRAGVLVNIDKNVPLNVESIGSVDTSKANHFNNSPAIPAVINNHHEALKTSCSKYRSHNNLVDLTGFTGNSKTDNLTSSINDINTLNTVTTTGNKVECFKITPPVTNNQSNTKRDITEPSAFTMKNMNSPAKYKEIEDHLRRLNSDDPRNDDCSSSGASKHTDDCIDKKPWRPKINTSLKEKSNDETRERNYSPHKELDIKKYKDEDKVDRNKSSEPRKNKIESPKPKNDFLRTSTLSETEQNNLSPGALQRYLAYQRFLGNYYKKDNEKKTSKSSQRNHAKIIENKTSHPPSTEKSELRSEIEPNKKLEPIKKSISGTDKKRATSNVSQNKKKESIIEEHARNIERKKKKAEITERLNRYLELKKKKEQLSKINYFNAARKESKEEKVSRYSERPDRAKEYTNKNRNRYSTPSSRKPVRGSELNKKKENTNDKQSDKKPKEKIVIKSNDKAKITSSAYKIKREKLNHTMHRYKSQERKSKTNKIKSSPKSSVERKERDKISKQRDESRHSVKSCSVVSKVSTCPINTETKIINLKSHASDIQEKTRHIHLQSKHDSENDLRTVLNRKRNKNHYYSESKRIKTSTPQRENLIITVNQDVNTSKVSAAEMSEINIAHTRSRPKIKKSKKIKLVINIECPASEDSDQASTECSTSPIQDLSFLDDFDVDDIVDSLNTNQNSVTEDDISIKEDFYEMDDSENNVNTAREDSISHVFQKEGSITTNTDEYENTTESVEEIACVISGPDECQREFYNDINHNNQPVFSDSNDYTTSKSCQKAEIVSKLDDQKNIVALEPCNDDVYEVVDITDDDKETTTILLEDDATDLEVNDMKRKIDETSNKSCINIYKHAETLTKMSKEITEDVIVKEISETKTKPLLENIDLPITHKLQHTKSANIKTDRLKTNDTDTKEAKFWATKDSNVLSETEDAVEKKIKKEPEVQVSNGIEYSIENKDVCKDANSHASESSNMNTLQDQPSTSKQKYGDVHELENESSIKTNEYTIKMTNEAKEVISVNSTQDPNKPVTVESTAKTEDSQPQNKLIKSNDVISSGRNNSNSNVINMVNTKKSADKSDNKLTKHSIAKIEINSTSVEKRVGNQNDEKSKMSNETPEHNKRHVAIEKSVSNVLENKNRGKNIVNFKEVPDSKPCLKSKIPEKMSPGLKNPYIKNIEKRMFEYLDERFTITAVIHKGHYSKIYKCRNAIGGAFALKVLKNQFMSMGIYKNRIFTDLQKYTNKDSYFILEILNSFNFLGEWCFLTDYYPKTLEEVLGGIRETSLHIDLVQFLARQLVAAVAMLHNNNIVHTDIKPSHILLDYTCQKLKLCGFDRSDFNYNLHIKPSSGSTNYRAPEIILGYNADGGIDVWATAVVIFEMSTGSKLFPGCFNNEILYGQLIKFGPLDSDMVQGCKLRRSYFSGNKFMRQTGNRQWVLTKIFERKNKLRNQLTASYNNKWKKTRKEWEITEDYHKLKMLHSMLEQMLVMNPEHRVPISFVETNEFFSDGPVYF